MSNSRNAANSAERLARTMAATGDLTKLTELRRRVKVSMRLGNTLTPDTCAKLLGLDRSDLT